MSLQTRLSDLITAIGTDYKTLVGRIGNLPSLSTTAKTDLVSAINEVNGKAPGAVINDTTPSSTSTYSSSKVDSLRTSDSTADRTRSNHTGTQTAATISDFASAADARITAQKGANSGLATLDSGGKVPSTQLPAYVDDVLEYANAAALPATGTTGIIYTTLDNNKIFRWGGSSYIEISGSPGSSDAVPEGTTNLYYTTARSGLKMDKSANLSDLGSVATARTNLSVYSQAELGDPETNLVTLYTNAKA